MGSLDLKTAKQNAAHALTLRAEIKDLLSQMVDGRIVLDALPKEVLSWGIYVHREIVEQTKTCGGTIPELTAIAQKLRSVKVAFQAAA